MKFAAAMFLAWMTLIIIPCCSKKESPDISDKRVRIRQPIKKQEKDKVIKSAPSIPDSEIVYKNTGTIDTVEKKESVKTEGAKEDEKPGFYITKEGDSLSSIASKEDVYGDPIKWPILYRYNRDSLSGIFGKGDLLEMELPEDMPLRIITPDEFADNLRNRSGRYVVINILSSPQIDKLFPLVVKLVNNNYPAYLTRLDAKGKDWMRLRVGFYDTKKHARKIGEDIKSLLGISDIWITRVGDSEFGEFGGY